MARSAASEELTNIFSRAEELDISGITVEFFHPDSVSAEARASPKTLKVEKAAAKSNSVSQTNAVRISESSDSVSSNIASVSNSSQQFSEDLNTKSPMEGVVFFAVNIFILSVFLFIIFRKHKSAD